MAKDEYPPYTPMPSLGHELGLMFGFLALCAIVMAAYVALWRGALSSSTLLFHQLHSTNPYSIFDNFYPRPIHTSPRYSYRKHPIFINLHKLTTHFE